MLPILATALEVPALSMKRHANASSSALTAEIAAGGLLVATVSVRFVADPAVIVTQEDLDPNGSRTTSVLQLRKLQAQVTATLELATTPETTATVFVEAFTAAVLLATVVVFVGTLVATATVTIPRQALPVPIVTLPSTAPPKVHVVPIYAAWLMPSHLV